MFAVHNLHRLRRFSTLGGSNNCKRSPGGGHSTLGYAPCATKKTLLFFARSHRKTPIFTNFHPMTPIFNKLLVTEIPWHIFVTQRPLIFAFSSQTSDNFRQKIWIFRKFRRNVEKFLAILALKAAIFWCFSLIDPLFWCALSLKDPLFWRYLSPKDPYIWGAAWWHSYVTFICECPPPGAKWAD